MSTYETMEMLGEQADTLDNLLHAAQLPMPAQTHLDCMLPNIKEVMLKLREIYVIETGDNPWSDHP